MPTVKAWVVLGEDGSCEVATDEDTALARLKDGSDDDLVGTMSEPRYRDDDDETDKAVDVTIPDDAGRIVELE